MQEPTQITPRSVNGCLGALTRAVFWPGISWGVIEAAWDGFGGPVPSPDDWRTSRGETGTDLERI